MDIYTGNMFHLSTFLYSPALWRCSCILQLSCSLGCKMVKCFHSCRKFAHVDGGLWYKAGKRRQMTMYKKSNGQREHDKGERERGREWSGLSLISLALTYIMHRDTSAFYHPLIFWGLYESHINRMKRSQAKYTELYSVCKVYLSYDLFLCFIYDLLFIH